MKKLSIGTRLAWHIASWEAVISQFQFIEKEHLLLGVLSLQKLNKMEVLQRLSEIEVNKLHIELKQLDALLEENKITATGIRRHLRARLEKGKFNHRDRTIHRSNESRRIFKHAIELAEFTQEVDILHLLASILVNPGAMIIKSLSAFHIKPKKLWMHVLSNEINDDESRQSTGMSRHDFKHVQTFSRNSDVSILTIMFDDIVGSTALYHKLGDEDFYKLIKYHDESINKIVCKNGRGEIIKSTGDGLLMVFSKPVDAVQCAMEIQEEFLAHRILSVRIGMDMGEVRQVLDKKSRDVFGIRVSTASRITGAAKGGHVLTSKTVCEAAKKEILEESLKWKFLGTRKFNPGEPNIDIYEVFNVEIIQEPMSALPLRSNKTIKKSRLLSNSKHPFLDQFGRNLTREAKRGRLGPFAGRQDEILKIVQFFKRQPRKNLLLVGMSGVGKTSLVEAFAIEIIKIDNPDLSSRKIISVNLDTLMVHLKDEDKFEKRLKSILKEAKSNPEIILIIYNIHKYIGLEKTDIYLKIANLLNPVIAKGDVQIVGTTTLSEYHRYIEPENQLEQCFQKMMIKEPSKEEALEMLKTFQMKLEQYHQVWVTERALEAAIDLSIRFDPDNNLPGKAVEVMEEAGAHIQDPNMFADGNTILNELSIAKVIAGRVGMPLEQVIRSLDN